MHLSFVRLLRSSTIRTRHSLISNLLSHAHPAMAELAKQIAAQGEKVRALKQRNDPASASELATELASLMALKAQLAAENPSKVPVKFQLKTAKGTRDFGPREMIVRERMFRTITGIFKLHGGVTIDTPVFELKEILSGKYGEDSKLIYDLQDQGGELCSLRYDLTVPFARYVAMNPGDIKRYHIAKVYRRDQPVVSKGRMREFYQCDFDIAGQYDPMLPDAEILMITTSILEGLGIGEEFTIKLNHRKILDGIFAVCGVPQDKIRTISSAVDKLDKSPWPVVREEMLQKGLEGEVADKIWQYAQLKGGADLLKKLAEDATFMSNPSAAAGLADMQILFGYLDAYGITSKMSFDLSLARGLDYYTGIIYEAVVSGSAPPVQADGKKAKPKPAAEGQDDEIDASTVGVGSIAAGGRYDELVGMFSAKDGVPCVGISFGVERIFSLLMKNAQAQALRPKETEVFVMSLGKDDLTKERMMVAKRLWDAGIKAEFLYKTKPKGPRQFDTIDRDGIPFAVMLGKKEWSEGQVLVKAQRGKSDNLTEKDEGVAVPLEDLAEYLGKRVKQWQTTGSFDL